MIDWSVLLSWLLKKIIIINLIYLRQNHPTYMQHTCVLLSMHLNHKRLWKRGDCYQFQSQTEFHDLPINKHSTLQQKWNMIFLHTSYGHLIFGNHKTANFNSFTPIQYKVINFVSLTEIRGGNPVMLSFKWNLFSRTLAWCYLFVWILQKEILILIVSVIFFCHH